MTFREALLPFLHPIYGVVSNREPDPVTPLGQSCDNYHLFTAEAISLCFALNEEVSSLVRAHLNFIAKCSDRPGAPRRFPGSTGDVSYDEIIGCAYTGWVAGSGGLSLQLVEYGLANDWVWNLNGDATLDLQYYFARNICFVAFLKACARYRVGIVSQVLWSVGLLLSLFTPKEDTSGKLLCYIQIAPMREAGGWVVQAAIALWTARMASVYGGPIQLYRIYFGAHPLAAFQPNRWP